MIVLPETRVPAVDGVNEKVAATLLLLETRSVLEIWNEFRVRYIISCDIARIPLPSSGTEVGVNSFMSVEMSRPLPSCDEFK